MEQIIVRDYENCFICYEYMGTFKNEFTVVTGYSEKPIYKLWEQFSQVELTQNEIESGGVCQNCFIKFNEHDELINSAQKIETELLILYEKATTKIEVIEDNVVVEDVIIETIEVGDMKFEDESLILDTKPKLKSMKIPKSSKQPAVVNKIDSKIDRDAGLRYFLIDGVKKYECDICGKGFFDNRSRLKAHRMIHTDERNFICGTCNASFKTLNCLKNHMRLHNNIFYHCDLCPSKFKGKHELRCHVDAVHLMKKDHICQICGKAFSRDKTLRQHIIYHFNERNVVCEICGFKTINRPKMTRHMKSHTREREYECPICKKKFLYSYNVKSHIRHVHNHEKRPSTNEDKLTCTICNKKFQKIWKVKQHMAEVHNIESQEFEIENIQILNC